MKARNTTAAKSDFLSGAMDDNVASWTPAVRQFNKKDEIIFQLFNLPILPGLAKPHRAYVAITVDL